MNNILEMEEVERFILTKAREDKKIKILFSTSRVRFQADDAMIDANLSTVKDMEVLVNNEDWMPISEASKLRRVEVTLF